MRSTPSLLWLVLQTSIAGAQAGAADERSMVESSESAADAADVTGDEGCSPNEPRDSKHEAVCNMLQAWKRGDWAEARRNAEIVHAVKPTARTWLFLAKCDYKLGQYAGAIVECERALEQNDPPLPPNARLECDELIEVAGESVAAYRLDISPPTAELRVDETTAIRRRSGELLIAPGEHRFEVHAPGHVGQSLRVVAQANTKVELTLELTPALAPRRMALAPARSVRGDVAVRHEVDDRDHGAWIWVLGGSAAALGATSGALYALASEEHDRLARLCRGTCAREDPRADTGKRDRLAVTALVAGATAGAAGIAAITLFIFDASSGSAPAEPRGRASPAAALTIDLERVAIGARF